MDDVTVGVLVFSDVSASEGHDVSTGLLEERPLNSSCGQVQSTSNAGDVVDADTSVVRDFINRKRKHSEANFFM